MIFDDLASNAYFVQLIHSMSFQQLIDSMSLQQLIDSMSLEQLIEKTGQTHQIFWWVSTSFFQPVVAFDSPPLGMGGPKGKAPRLGAPRT